MLSPTLDIADIDKKFWEAVHREAERGKKNTTQPKPRWHTVGLIH